MTLVQITSAGDDAALLDAHLAFHLNAGVDVIIANAAESGEAVTDVLAAYEGSGLMRPVSGSLTDLARLATTEHGADWVFASEADEFWWPRGESLKEVLAVIPPRYAVVQALVRDFAGSDLGNGLFAERRTHRASLLTAEQPPRQPLARMLRPVYRATSTMEIDPDDWTLGGRRVPLRAWYPIEVLRFSTPPAVGAAPLVEDVRLLDALRELRTGSDVAEGRGYALPGDGVGRVTFPVPNVVDDASYAIECAAVGEVDLVGLDSQIRELEARIAQLEATFWPRFRSTVRRLARLRR
jgi:hypothetical protein